MTIKAMLRSGLLASTLLAAAVHAAPRIGEPAPAFTAVDSNGRDVSAYLISGAEQALELARARHIRIAVLKEGSPSCGTGFIFDGTFTDTRVKDRGVTAAILQQAGVHVFSEAQLAEADALLRKIEADNVA